MGKSLIFVIISIIVLLLIAGFFVYYNKSLKNSRESANVQQKIINNSSTTQAETLPPESKQVIISGYSFSPKEVTVPKGSTITWTNNDNMPHTVTSNTGETMQSNTLNKGDSYSYTFDKKGSYFYYCKFHSSMKAVVIVI